jgi:hypothetical protein
MKNLIYIFTIIFSLCITSCSAKKESYLGESKLLISIEKRDYNTDQVSQINFFDNGLKQEIILHDTSSKDKLFKADLKQINSKELESVKAFLSKLNTLEYENSFPWKEGLYDRANLYKISFVTSKKLEYIARQDKKDDSEVSFEKILYYYQGHKESPQVFKDLIAYIDSL